MHIKYKATITSSYPHLPKTLQKQSQTRLHSSSTSVQGRTTVLSEGRTALAAKNRTTSCTALTAVNKLQSRNTNIKNQNYTSSKQYSKSNTTSYCISKRSGQSPTFRPKHISSNKSK